MSWVDEDRKLVIAAANELDDFLNSKQLSWRLMGSVGNLSIGTLLLSLRRIKVILNQSEDVELERYINEIDQIQSKRLSAWSRKIDLEIPYRLRLWENWLEEFLEEGTLNPSYRAQIRERVVLELLMMESQTVRSEYVQVLEHGDQSLRKISKPGSFIWNLELIQAFDNQSFWFLYVDLVR